MASITSLSNSSYSTSSIYGNRNVLSGLASGMDTETMIENAVSGIKMKIENLVKKRTKVEWQQEAYRSIIDKAVNFNNKYTSYSSKTNLLSQSFFTNAVNTVANGTYKDKVSASGKSSSEVKINAVKEMAQAAAYTVSGMGGVGGALDQITGDKAFSLSETMPVSTVSGSLSFQYGGTNGTSFDISFEELENLNEVKVLDDKGNVKENPSSAEKLAQAIKNKLGEITYNYTKNGVKETTTADKAIKVEVSSGKITFSDGLGNGNSVKISSASGDIKSKFGLSGSEHESINVGNAALTKSVSTESYLKDKDLGITYNGSTKSISMADVFSRAGISSTDDEDTKNNKFRDALQEELNDAFGQGKIAVSKDPDGKLVFNTPGDGNVLSLGGSAVKAMGFESGDSNFINPSKKLSELLGEDSKVLSQNRLRGTFLTYDSKPIEKTDGSGAKYYVDHKGNRVDQDGFRITDTGKAIYDLQVNDAHIEVTGDTTLESLMNSINSNPDAGMKVSYSKLTNEFKFTTTETGANSKIKFGGLAKDLFAAHDRSATDKFSETYGISLENEIGFQIEGVGTYSYSSGLDENSTMQDVVDRLNKSLNTNHQMTASFDELSGRIMITDDKTGKTVDFKMVNENDVEYELPDFGSSYTTGQDAVMDVEINGKRFEDLTRSSNTFDIDGLTINVKGTFNRDGSNVDKDGNAIEAVTFQTSTDSDKLVDTIREFVDDYNTMVTEIKNAYSTLPAEKKKGQRYEPLTAEEEDKYSESELKAYNEKAKQGILFGDTNLSSMYGKLLNAISPGGTDGQTLREIGISTSYSDGLTTLSLDEDKLRSALESDPDKVRTAFTKTKEGGASSDGLMQNMQNTLNAYVKTVGEPKGILITRAGSVKSPNSLNNNSLKSQIDNIDKQIDRWQDKMSDQIDRYTTQFSRLEQLIAEMNSQASAMSGLMGGQGGY